MALTSIGALLVVLPACGDASAGVAAGVARQPILYGNDDRREAGHDETPAPIVALIPQATLASLADGGVPPNFEQTHHTCPGERFAKQTAIATCSGVMIGPDLLLTAAHCIEAVTSCADYAYVRNYAVQADGGLPAIDQLERLGCESVLVQTHTSILDGQQLDFAVLRLDRVLAPFESPMLRTLAPEAGEAVTSIGANGGLPFKAARGTVRDARTAGDYFTFTADVFAGGSGSAIFDDTGALLGIEVRGAADFESTPEGCHRARVVPEDGEDAEEANLLGPILDALCDVEPDATACDRSRDEPESSPPGEPAESQPEVPGPAPEITPPLGALTPPSNDEPPQTVPPNDDRANAPVSPHPVMSGDRESSSACSFGARRFDTRADIALAMLLLTVAWGHRRRGYVSPSYPPRSAAS